MRIARDAESAEARAPALARHPTDDDELFVTVALDLDPIVAARRPRPVHGGFAFGDDAFEPILRAEVEERASVVVDVIERTQQALTLHDATQELLARREGQAAQIAIAERQDVEHEVGDGHLALHAQHVERPLGVDARAEAVKARAPLVVERDDFAVEHHALGREGTHGARDFRYAAVAERPFR